MTIFQDLDHLSEYVNARERSAERGLGRVANFTAQIMFANDRDRARDARAALERVRASVGSELATRLRAVEEDLAKLHAAHANHKHEENPINSGGCTSKPVVLISGEPAEVLNTAEQDARSWALIEKWYASRAVPGYQLPVLEVEITGPFIGIASDSYYVRLPGGHAARGHTRSDALAHAAEYCKGLL